MLLEYDCKKIDKVYELFASSILLQTNVLRMQQTKLQLQPQ